jgi:hypothetical protein
MSCIRPVLHAGLVRSAEHRRIPVEHQTAGGIVARLHAAERVAGFVAGAAMREALHQIGAAIPLVAFRSASGLENRGFEEQRAPADQRSRAS